jgi:hypothetical protein
MPRRPNPNPGQPYIRQDGRPHASSWGPTRPQFAGNPSNPGKNTSVRDNKLLPAPEITGNNPAFQILAEMDRQKGASFDPNDPESAVYDTARKFTREKKLEFCQNLATHGVINHSAFTVGVTAGSVQRHRKLDPVFNEMCEVALNRYAAMAVTVLKQQALFGLPDMKFDKDGNLISLRTQIVPRLQELMLKRYAPEFQETQKQEITVQGGAVLVPSPTDNVSNWDQVVAQLEQASASPQALEQSNNPMGLPSPIDGTMGHPVPAIDTLPDDERMCFEPPVETTGQETE